MSRTFSGHCLFQMEAGVISDMDSFDLSVSSRRLYPERFVFWVWVLGWVLGWVLYPNLKIFIPKTQAQKPKILYQNPKPQNFYTQIQNLKPKPKKALKFG